VCVINVDYVKIPIHVCKVRVPGLLILGLFRPSR